jgi:hypothetical protein
MFTSRKSLICMTSLAMTLLLPFVLFLSIHYRWDLPAPLIPIGNRLQNYCDSWFAHPTNPNDLSRSFVCGEKITQAANKMLLQKSGIYHAIVVSGGHFLFIAAVLKRMSIPAWLRMIALFLYYLTTGLQAPGLRCLTQMSLGSAVKSANLKLSSSALCFYSGLVCLIISNPLWNSLSFWLSFSVSMSLCFSDDFTTQDQRGPSRQFLSLFFIYLFVFPFNFSSGYLHPLNLVFGVILLYPFCFVLLLSSVLILMARLFGLDFLLPITTQIDSGMYILLKKWTLLIPDKNRGSQNIFLFWCFLFILISLFHLTRVHFRRETIRE